MSICWPKDYFEIYSINNSKGDIYRAEVLKYQLQSIFFTIYKLSSELTYQLTADSCFESNFQELSDFYQLVMLTGSIYGQMNYINKMSYNDKQSNDLQLLTWVNRERCLIGQYFKIYSLAQLKQSRLLPTLLRRISLSFFSQLSDKQFDYKCYLIEIERYLMEMQDLRIKRSYHHNLLESENMSDMVKLVLFLIMKQDIKQEYINRILQLEEDTQIYLMNELKRLQKCIENNVQIKEIHQKIEELQSQNEDLNQKLKLIEQQAGAIKNIETTLREQNQQLKVQDHQYKMEKTDVLEAIGTDQLMKDYLALYKDVQLEQKQAITTYKEIQSDASQLQQNNRQISDKIQEDHLIIEHLSEELSTFRALYQQAKADAYHHQKAINKENLPRKSLTTIGLNKLLKNQSDDDHTATSRSANILDELDEPLEEIMKNYSDGLMGKLQSMYAKITNLQHDISSLKDKNCKLVTSNRKKQKKIAMAEQQFKCFVLNYQFTISG